MNLNRYLKIFSILFSLLSFGHSGLAQQDPLYSLHMFNPSTINPAYVGSAEFRKVIWQSRQQWVGFDGAPVTNLFQYSQPIPYLDAAIGATILNDTYGPVSSTSALADLAYRFKITHSSKLALGARIGFRYISLNLSDVYTNNDPAFSHDKQSNLLPALGFGLFYYAHDYFIGISTPEMVTNVNVFSKYSEVKQLPNEEQHYYLSGAYVFHVLPRNLALKTTLLMKMVKAAPPSVELGAYTILFEKYWLGANYRFNESFTPMVKFQFKQWLEIAYAYDVGLNKLRTFNSGTHEFALFFNFNKQEERVVSPRFF